MHHISDLENLFVVHHQCILRTFMVGHDKEKMFMTVPCTYLLLIENCIRFVCGS